MSKIRTIVYVVVGLFLFTSILQAQNKSVDAKQIGISFEHSSWEDILKKAKEENKLIFIDAYTTWCGPCKMMARNVFTDAEVGTFFNQNFINVKLDMEKERA